MTPWHWHIGQSDRQLEKAPAVAGTSLRLHCIALELEWPKDQTAHILRYIILQYSYLEWPKYKTAKPLLYTV